MTPLREIREGIATTTPARDTDPDIFAEAIRNAIRGGS